MEKDKIKRPRIGTMKTEAGRLAGAAHVVQSWGLDTVKEPAEIEESLFAKTVEIVEAAMDFSQVEGEEAIDLPEDWVARYGRVEAERRFRVAKAAWMPLARAPAGLSMAKSILVGIVKARADREGGHKELNVAVQMVNVAPALPSKDIE